LYRKIFGAMYEMSH